MENIHFPNRPHVGHLIKASCLGASYTKSAPCLVWYRYSFCRLRYVFYLSRDPTKPLRWDVMHIHGWELLAACHHSEKFGDHRHSDSKRKTLHQKRGSYKYVLPLKNWDERTTTRREKMSQPQKCTFWEKVLKN